MTLNYRHLPVRIPIVLPLSLLPSSASSPKSQSRLRPRGLHPSVHPNPKTQPNHLGLSAILWLWESHSGQSIFAPGPVPDPFALLNVSAISALSRQHKNHIGTILRPKHRKPFFHHPDRPITHPIPHFCSLLPQRRQQAKQTPSCRLWPVNYTTTLTFSRY